MKNEALTGWIIEAAIKVHKALGSGFLETVYEEALAIEFDSGGICYERQKVVPIFYRARQAGEHGLDFLIENQVVVELNAVAKLEKIFFAVVRPYLKATGTECGPLFNFAAMPLAIKRIAPEEPKYLVANP